MNKIISCKIVEIQKGQNFFNARSQGSLTMTLEGLDCQLSNGAIKMR